MSKKWIIVIAAIALILLLITSGSAMANPVPWPVTPNQDKPNVAIITPQNNTVFAYNDTDAWLNFTVSTPDTWIIQHMVDIPIGRLDSVKAYLDDNSVYNGYTKGGQVKLNLNQTAPGPHMLNVTVLYYTYYRGPAYNGSHIPSDIMSSSGTVYQYPATASDTLYFTIEQPTQSTQTLNTQPIDQTFPLWIIPLIILVAIIPVVAVLALRKKKPEV